MVIGNRGTTWNQNEQINEDKFIKLSDHFILNWDAWEGTLHCTLYCIILLHSCQARGYLDFKEFATGNILYVQ